MESNREEALRALEIARRKKAEGDLTGALKFARKSLSLFSNPQTEAFIQSLSDTPAQNGTAYASGTSTSSTLNSDRAASRKKETEQKHTEHRQGRQDTQYSNDQVAIVERVRKCKHHQYYEILELETTATDSEVKKSYRRLALQLHPDKNAAPGADEAFKMVSRAFQVLSDPDKRAAFDRHGEDPDSRMAGMGGGGFSGFRTYGGGNGMYGDEISPEDLFNMFFGSSGINAGGFSSGPFGAQFGGPGVRIHTFGSGIPRRQQAQQGQPQGNAAIIYQLLPVLILLAITIIPALFGSSSSPPPTPSFVFEAAKPPYTLRRLTPHHSISYFINPSDVASWSNSKLRQLDQKAEITFIRGLRDECQIEYDTRQQRMAAAQGWWGQIKDQEAWDAARTLKLRSCEKLMGMGYRPEVY